MTYTKNTWVDQTGQVRYTKTEDDGYWVLTPNYEEVTEIGTPVNADNMNHIEQGIYDCYAEIDNKINTMLQALYPVGSLYISTNNTNPLESLFGTWTLVSAGRALWTGNGSNANTTIAAGLPNITGHARNGAPDDGICSWTHTNGAFYGVSSGSAAYNVENTGGTSTANKNLYFDASRSSSVYGKSTTVQPPAYVVNVWRRVA